MPSYLLRLSRLLKRARTQHRSLKLLRTFDSPLRLLRKRVAAFDSFASDLTEGRLLRERLTRMNNVQPPCEGGVGCALRTLHVRNYVVWV